jgi:hypothetical protein
MRSLFPTMFGKAVALLESTLEMLVLALEPRLGDHVADLDQQLVVVPGLREIIVGARLQRIHRHLDRTIGGQHDHGGLVIFLAQLPENVHA